ncbi:MAG: preprotein translocase subunit SecE [Armatimonadota bacterium]
MRAAAQEARVGGGRIGFATRVKSFFRDSWLELQKVIWPKFDDVVKMTGVVVVVVFIVGMFIFLWDRVLWTLTKPLFQ